MKKLSTLFLFVLLALAAVNLSSCKKYEDGPFFSIKSPEARLQRTWRVTKAVSGSNDLTSLFQLVNYKVEFKSSEVSIVYSNFLTGTTIEKGTWKWAAADKKSIQITQTVTGNSQTSTWDITRLTSKELHASYTSVENGVQVLNSFEFEAD
jgi:hypothetical protein